MLPLLGQGATIGPREERRLFVKPLATLSASPIRNNSLKGRQPQQHGMVESKNRIKSADSEPVSKSEENFNDSESNANPQSMAISRVMKSIRRQRLIQQQTKVTPDRQTHRLTNSLVLLIGRDEEREDGSHGEDSDEMFSKASPEGRGLCHQRLFEVAGAAAI
jgi:hypothetical protein